MIRKIIKALWILLAVVVLAIVVIFVSISKGWIGYMPPVEELENPNYKFATEIFSEDGKVLGTWSYSKENRVYTAYKDLSPNIINALIATEDVRFVEHSGIDAKALFRAFVKRGLMFQKNAGGGSTLSQQLAKQLFTENVARNTLQRLFQKALTRLYKFPTLAAGRKDLLTWLCSIANVPAGHADCSKRSVSTTR